jgi:hypothetical protein
MPYFLEQRSYRCIGSYEDSSNDKMYYFVFSTQGDHHILEYDILTNSVSVVFRDCGVQSDNLFNWLDRFLITEINKIDDVLYFTSDRYGEPQELNVRKSKNSMAEIDSGGYTEATRNKLDADPDTYYPYNMYISLPVFGDFPNNYPYQSVSEFKRQYIEVKKRPPYTKTKFTFGTDPDIKKNNIYGKSFQFRYRYHYYDKQVSEWSMISDPSHSDEMKTNVASATASSQNFDNLLSLELYNGNQQVEYIEICARTCKDFDVDKNGNRGDYYIIGKIKNNYSKFLTDESVSFSFYNDKIYPFADKNETAKLYDNVPKRARTQTLLSDNRISYANYLESFDLDGIDVKLTPKYGEVSSAQDVSDLIYPGWTVSSSGELSGGWSGSTVDNQKASAYADATSGGPSQSAIFTNSAIDGLSGLPLGSTIGLSLASKPTSSLDQQIVVGPYNDNNNSKKLYGPRDAQSIGGSSPSFQYNSLDGQGRDKESYHVNRLISYPNNNGYPAFCGETVSHNNFNVINFVFKYGEMTPTSNKIINIILDFEFAVRASNAGNAVSIDKAQDSISQKVSISKIINTADSGETFSEDDSGLDSQMIYVAKRLNLEYEKYEFYTDKPDDGEIAWQKGCFVDVEKKVLVLPLISPNKTTFAPSLPFSLQSDNSESQYRLICTQKWNHPDYSAELEGDKFAGISLNFNFPNNNADPALSSANKNNLAILESVGYNSGDGKSGSFKSGAFHDFGIIYYDGKGRCSTVAIDSENGTSQCYVKFFSERNNTDNAINAGQDNLFGKASIDWEVNHQPPIWAKYWSWAYSKNTSVDEFIQFICPGAFTSTAPATGESRIFLSLASLKGSRDSYKEQSNPLIDYNYVEGDRIRFITSPYNYGDASPFLNTYLDVKITGYEFYNGSGDAAGEPLDEQGFFITIEDLSNFTATSGFDWINNNPSSNNFFADGLFEIYRPMKEIEDTSNRVYYEFGFKHTIANPHGPNRAHRGMTDTQVVDVSPAKGYFEEGDVFFKRRIMRNSTESGAGSRFTISFVEDYHLNDFYPTNHINIGRPNVFNPYAKEELKESSVIYSEPFQPDVNYNGLSTFELFTYSDFNKEDGSIQKIHSRDTDLIMIQEDRTYKVTVNKDIITNADGSTNVGLSSNVLGNAIAFSEHYGISKNPESFTFDGNILFWVDIKKGAVLRLRGNELAVISKINMVDYFRDKSEIYRECDPTAGFTYNVNRWQDEPSPKTGLPEQFKPKNYLFRILGAYNPKHDEYVISFPDLFEDLNRFDNDGDKWSGKGAAPENVLPSLSLIQSGETIVWSERNERWSSFASYLPEMYGKINKRFFSFEGGDLFHHDSDTSNYNTFYGVTFDTKLKFPFNGLPNKVKTYHSITVDGTFADDSTSQGVESGTKTGYETNIDTNLSSTSIDKTAYDRKEGILYANIPFATGNVDGEPGGSEYYGIGEVTTSNVSNTVTLADSPNPGVNVGDKIYYNNAGTNTLIGTISSIGASSYTLTANAAVTITSTFAYVIKSGEAEGDRMKGNFMNVELIKKTKKPIEIYSVNSNISKSELSEE